jgi:hypothetical protein
MRTTRTPVFITAALLLGATACGSSGGSAATAKQGDAFCKQAEVAKAEHDKLDAVDYTNPNEVKLTLGTAIDSLSVLVSKAPKDIKDTSQTLLDKEEELESLLKKNNYDFEKVYASDEGKKLIDSTELQKTSDDFDKYLSDKCGIASDTTDNTDVTDTTPLDTTGDTTSGTTGDSTGFTVDLGTGDDAINKFLDLYEMGTGQKLTDDQRKCVVDALRGKVSGDDLNKAINGEADAAVTQALGLAFITCNIVGGG